MMPHKIVSEELPVRSRRNLNHVPNRRINIMGASGQCEFSRAYGEQAVLDSCRPRLLVTIDTEEEFDWDAPFDRAARSVKNIAEQYLVQDIFDEASVVPTYVIDQAVVDHPDAVAYFKPLQDAGHCTIGAHLHPWLTRPFDEAVSNKNSFPGNLSGELETAKLESLTRDITTCLGQAPRVYKAGRYGLGPRTNTALVALGYQVDLSVVPHTDYSHKEGPNFAHFPDQPFWLDCGKEILALPLTCGYAGLLWPLGDMLYPPIAGNVGQSLHLPGILAKLGCLERVQLTPEGTKLEEVKKLTRVMYERGHRIFQYAFHSSSLLPGGNPYVSNIADRTRFLDSIKAYLDYFQYDFGGDMTTPTLLFNEAHAPA